MSKRRGQWNEFIRDYLRKLRKYPMDLVEY